MTYEAYDRTTSWSVLRRNKPSYSWKDQRVPGTVPWLEGVSDRLLTAEDRVRSKTGPCGIYGGKSGGGTDFSPSTSAFPRQYHSTMLHNHPFIYHQRHISLATDSIVK